MVLERNRYSFIFISQVTLMSNEYISLEASSVIIVRTLLHLCKESYVGMLGRQSLQFISFTFFSLQIPCGIVLQTVQASCFILENTFEAIHSPKALSGREQTREPKSFHYLVTLKQCFHYIICMCTYKPRSVFFFFFSSKGSKRGG